MHLAEGDWSYHANCEVQTSYALVLTPSFHKTWIFSVVYNGHRTMIQKILWKELSSLSFINTPWAIIGGILIRLLCLVSIKGAPFSTMPARLIFLLISLLIIPFWMLSLLVIFTLGAMGN